MDSHGELALLAGGTVYLVVLSWAMSHLSYDIWGVFVVIPPLLIMGVVGVRRLFRGPFEALTSVMYFGLVARFIGAGTKYFVSFGAYRGYTDAEEYHKYAASAASAVWSGKASFVDVLPRGTGTPFIEHTTAFFYTVVGSSKLAGYMVFSWLAFWGLAFFVKAACIAVPGLAIKRYAWLCVFAPSLVYWPASIGKEAIMMLSLGLASLGYARLLSRRGIAMPFLQIALGLGLTTLVRPHIAGLWLAGLFPALLVTLFRRPAARDARRGRGGERILFLVILGIAAIAIVAIGSATIRYLHPSSDETASSTSISSILTETTRRTSEAGSNFVPPAIDSPFDWPTAALRTLTRPLLIEANSAFQLLSSLEMTALIVMMLLSMSRLLNLPRLVVTNAFVAFAVTTVFLGGLAYSSFANLGVLARQKSLLLPLLFIVPCVPPHRSRVGVRRPREDTSARERGALTDEAALALASLSR